MSGGVRSRPGDAERSGPALPDVSVCRGAPGRLVFIESGNTDGWISTDAAVELSR